MAVETGFDQSTSTAAELTRERVLADYRVAVRSREASLLGRKEVLTGKAKFGIFGDGKEVAQLAMARAFRPGDWRAGYYRDQTFMMALGLLTVEELFAQLYANPDVDADPASAGRQMNAHFATRYLDEAGRFRAQVELHNVAADLSPTGSQMPKLVGLAYASRLYRELEELSAEPFRRFSAGGDEIAFGTIGNASCAEGMFWESVNAVGVLRSPLLLSIWDDGYGISVPNEHQVTKGSLSELLWGFQRGREGREGYDLYTVPGWDYPRLVETYVHAAAQIRREHVPAILHVVELTQPQGHSTSGSHERYKSAERLAWEQEWDGLRQMRRWMVGEELASDEELDALEEEERTHVRDAQRRAWEAYRAPVEAERGELVQHLAALADAVDDETAREELDAVRTALERRQAPFRRDLLAAAHDALLAVHEEEPPGTAELARWSHELRAAAEPLYDRHLYAEGEGSVLAVEPVPPVYGEEAPTLNGFEVLNRCFDAALARHPNLIAFGEDVGQLGDVNQGFAGLQAKYGVLRVSDTGIRETTILGQAIGMAMRGLRPIAEIQYLDYLLYALQIVSDDLASLRWRSAGGQMAPVIVRTRGHRLEGIWHSGSPMAGILGLVQGVWLCVPRDMTRAAGLYNTLLAADDPAIVIEVLNGYRVKERLPDNLADFRLPLGVPEVLRAGGDVTLVTYGACCRIAAEAAEQLARTGIEVEIVDVQTLLPFDRAGVILESIRKTSRVVFLDEDVPGGATAYMLQQVLEGQDAWTWLDSAPRTVSAKPHRPAYGSDGDYFSKPSREDVFRAVYELMHEAAPRRFPRFF
ncbi:MAG TPA: thiamine pyrophosphate-dependent enzyme [Thermoanaerobaculia bacterium]|nr:thiamine pyrophosphate-dependent enzyme [Thermoanaerobaculia bacterium]